MITEFGKTLRKIRIDRGEVLKDMAAKLEVSPSFISAIEVGKKKIPTGFLERIGDLYDLTTAEKQILMDTAKDTVTAVKINLLGSDSTQRRAALVFARDFGTLSDKTAEQILELLQKDANNKEGNL